MKVRAPYLLIALVTLPGVGCGGETRDASYVTTDSAGVTLVNNSAPLYPAGSWAVDPVPLIAIGEAEGNESELLNGVTSARLLHADTLVLVNAGSSEVRWYDGSGRHIRSIGRVGEGPGEFSRYGPGAMCVTHNRELVVGDPMQRRAAVFDAGGRLSRMISLRAAAAFPSIQGCFSDGSLLGWHSIGSKDRIPGQIIKTSFEWSRVSADGSTSAVLSSLPGAQQYLLDQGGGVATYHTIPFTVRPAAAAYDDVLYLVDGTASLQRRRMDGTLDAIVRWVPTNQMKSSDVYEQFRDHTLAGIQDPERRAGWQKFFALDIPRPEFVPASQSVLVDDGGAVWVQQYQLPWVVVVAWDVFDAQGRWITQVSLPDGFHALHISADAVVGVMRDADDVEQVQVYRLTRGK